MSEHRTPARASGSNPPAAMPERSEAIKAVYEALSATELVLNKLQELDIEQRIKSLEFRFDQHVGVTESRVLQESYSKHGNTEILRLDRLVGLHERIEVRYNVDSFLVILYSHEVNLERGLGKTIHEAFTDLVVRTKSWTLDSMRSSVGTNKPAGRQVRP